VREAAGLYHLSFHLPTLEDFARTFARLEAANYFQYPTDHGTHLANYIDDPDGIGLEYTFETPSEQRSAWDGTPGFEHGDAAPHWSNRDPRYLAWLRSNVPAGDTQAGLPAGTIVGHIHLRSADLDASLAFYRDSIGFTVNGDGRPNGFFDMSAGGTFPHRLACNNWESTGRPQRPADAAGMRCFTILLRSSDALDDSITRMESTGVRVERQRDRAIVTDPSGTRLILTSVDTP
jgi:catechol 2,3-dioxygenase